MMRTTDVVKVFDHKHPLRTIARLLHPQRHKLLLAFVLYGIKHSPIWALPLVTAGVIDVLVQNEPLDQLWFYAIVLLVLLGQNLPVNILFTMTLSRVLRDLEVRLRSALSERIQELSIGFWNRMNVASLQSKVVRDVENIEAGLRQAGNGGFAAIFNFVGAITITAIKVPQFLIFFLILLPIWGTIFVFSRRKLNSRNEDFRVSVEKMSIRTSEMMTLVPVTRAHGLESTALGNIEREFDKTKSAALQLDFVNAAFGASSWVIYNILNGVTLIAAVWATRTGLAEITAGEVVMLTGYFGVLSSAVVMMTDLAPNFARGLASIKSISEVLESDDLEPNQGKKVVQNVSGDIEFRDVRFSYPDSDEHAINGLSLSIKAGEYIAIAGPSGCGKSTLANLLIGFLRPTSGQVLVDGIDTADLDYRSIRQFISVVPQESVMFEGSVKENICYGDLSVSDENLMQALNDSNSWEFVSQLPEGIETDIGPRGFTLSGGQKQRLAIARAILRNPRILVLDEATSSLDNESELLVQQALNKLMSGRTTFVIAHRLSTIKDADCIYVMEDGKVVESGTHSELLDNGLLYARLHQLSGESLDS
jgi:ATP-binding cassette subfamily B protein